MFFYILYLSLKIFWLILRYFIVLICFISVCFYYAFHVCDDVIRFISQYQVWMRFDLDRFLLLIFMWNDFAWAFRRRLSSTCFSNFTDSLLCFSAYFLNSFPFLTFVWAFFSFVFIVFILTNFNATSNSLSSLCLEKEALLVSFESSWVYAAPSVSELSILDSLYSSTTWMDKRPSSFICCSQWD